MKTWSRSDWLIICLFAVLVTLFYWRILTPNPADRQSFPPGDFSTQFWAFATFEVRELSAGRLPLWNPYTFAGAPFWADVQSAVFYPPSLVTLLLSGPWGFSLFALEVEAIVHFWLAAVFTYLFLRRATASRGAAFVGALTFTFSGYLTGYPSQQLAVLETVVWLPLILFFLEEWRIGGLEGWKTGRFGRPEGESAETSNTCPPAGRVHPPSSIPLAGVAWGLALLAGHPQSAFIIACISTAYCVFTIASRPPTTNHQPPTQHATARSLPLGRNTQHATRFTACTRFLGVHVPRFTPYVLLPTLFLATGLALAAVQFLPAFEYTLLSVRAAGVYDKMAGGFPVIDLIQFLLPGQVSQYSPLYVGMAGLLLAAGGVLAARQRAVIFWAGVAAITLLISLGGHTFLYSLLYLAFPGFSMFRGQERWAVAVAFSLSVLAAYGFAALQEAEEQRSRGAEEQGNRGTGEPALTPTPFIQNSKLKIQNSLLRLTRGLFFFALFLVLIFFYGLNETGWTPESPFYGLLSGATLLSLVLGLAWLLWRFAPGLHPGLLAGLAAALVCFDLFTVNWSTNLYPQPPEWHTQVPAVVAAMKQDAALAPDEPFRVYNEFRLYDNYGVPFALEDLWGGSPLRPARYDRFLAPPMPIERTWELLNVKYVITWRKELYLPSTIIYQEPSGQDTTYLHRLTTVGPRAWLVNRAEIAGDDMILQKIADPGFDRWGVALLEPGAEPWAEQLNETTNQRVGESAGQRVSEPVKGDSSAVQDNEQSTTDQHARGNSAQPPLGTQHATRFTFQRAASLGEVSHFTSSTQSFSLQVTTPVPALLMLSETAYPGWQAVVDGQPAPLLRADYVLRAIPLSPGQHQVELTFRPLSFTLGAIISTLAALTVAGSLLIPRLKRSR